MQFVSTVNYVSGGVINLDSNRFTYLDSAVFKPIMTAFKDKGYNYNTHISAAFSNNFELN